MGRFSNRLFTSYTTFYILGLVFSMQIPFVGFQPIRTSEHMAAGGKFIKTNILLMLIVPFLFRFRCFCTNVCCWFIKISSNNTIEIRIQVSCCFWWFDICRSCILISSGSDLCWICCTMERQVKFDLILIDLNCILFCCLFVRFYSLWDTGYAKIHIPIIASVSEHQPTTWFSFFFDLHILVATFPAGLWYTIKNINDERVFGK